MDTSKTEQAMPSLMYSESPIQLAIYNYKICTVIDNFTAKYGVIGCEEKTHKSNTGPWKLSSVDQISVSNCKSCRDSTIIHTMRWVLMKWALRSASHSGHLRMVAGAISGGGGVVSAWVSRYSPSTDRTWWWSWGKQCNIYNIIVLEWSGNGAKNLYGSSGQRADCWEGTVLYWHVSRGYIGRSVMCQSKLHHCQIVSWRDLNWQELR